MSVYLNGVNMVADSLDELHKFARRLVISKSWYSSERECYDVICPHKLEYIKNYIERKLRKLRK